MGRLDKDSSGLILLTSDGRVNNALLDKSARQTKEYLVCVDKKVTSKQLEMLRTGVVIETPLQREENRMITARTLPAIVEVLEVRHAYFFEHACVCTLLWVWCLLDDR